MKKKKLIKHLSKELTGDAYAITGGVIEIDIEELGEIIENAESNTTDMVVYCVSCFVAGAMATLLILTGYGVV